MFSSHRYVRRTSTQTTRRRTRPKPPHTLASAPPVTVHTGHGGPAPSWLSYRHPDYRRLAGLDGQHSAAYLKRLAFVLSQMRHLSRQRGVHGRLPYACVGKIISEARDKRTVRRALDAMAQAGVIVQDGEHLMMPNYHLSEGHRKKEQARIAQQKAAQSARQRLRRARLKADVIGIKGLQPPGIIEENKVTRTGFKTLPSESEKHLWQPVRISPLGMAPQELEDLCDALAAPPVADVDRKRSEDIPELQHMDPELAQSLLRLRQRLQPTLEVQEDIPVAVAPRPHRAPLAKQGHTSVPARRVGKPIDPGLPVSSDWIKRHVHHHPQFSGVKAHAVVRMGLGTNSLRVGLEQLLASPKRWDNPPGALINAARQYQSGAWRL